MKKTKLGVLTAMGLCGSLLVGGALTAGAQTTAAPAAPAAPVLKKAPAGKQIELNGAVASRDGEQFILRLLDRSEYRVLLTDQTVIKTERKGVFRAGKAFDVTSIIVGLICGVDGTGNEAGDVVAKKVHFTDQDLKAAITAQIHAAPIAASAAAAHERIGALDEWDERGVVSVFFATGSSTISAEGKKALDELAAKAPGATNYKVEITGHTDSTGDDPVNQELSEKRAENVVRYLTVTHKIPLRRVVLPMGYSATQGTADNSTEEGRAKNRRVDVRVLVNKGASQAPPAGG